MRRIRDTKLLAALKLELDECEVTGQTWNLHLHHVYFKSQQGDDLRSNIVCLAEELHRRYHESDAEAMSVVARYISACRPDTMLYLEDKLGSREALGLWLERHGVKGEGYDQQADARDGLLRRSL